MLAICCGLGIPVHGASPNYLERAEDLIAAIYPNLSGGLETEISAGLWLNRKPTNHFAISLCSAPGAQERGCPFTASFTFIVGSRDLELANMQATEERLDHRIDEFIAAADQHPDWSEAEVAGALTAAGAHYGPARRERFVASLPLAVLEPYMGHLSVVSAKFWGPPKGERRFSSLQWEVHVKRHRKGSPDKTYTLWFEPFEGKLVAIDVDL